MSTHPAIFKGPPTDIASRKLPLLSLSSELWRIHPSCRAPIFASKAQGRFSGPTLPFGVCYGSLSLIGAFAETLVDEAQNSTFVASGSLVLEHSYSLIVVSSALKLVDLTGNAVTSIGTTHRINSIDKYHLTQQWAEAFFNHPQQPDGILYVANLAGREKSVAIFDRAFIKLSARAPIPFALNSTLDGIIKKLGVVLIPGQ